MIKKDQYTYIGGMNTDNSPSKRSKDQYYFLKNGRITSWYSDGDNNNFANNGVLRCQAGNELAFEITSIDSISQSVDGILVSYKIDGVAKNKLFQGKSNSEIVLLNSLLPDTNIYIVGTASYGSGVYILTSSESSIDCIWNYTQSSGLDLLYINNFGWNNIADKHFDVVINIENESVTKMYIADGVNQILSFNLVGSADISRPKKVLYMVPQYNMSQPELRQQINGGQHTSGAIQYTYNLFNVNGSQTKMSPVSELIFMGKSNNGGDVNEIVGKSNIIQIDNIDTSYDYIKIYSIKYNDLNTIPIVSVIGEYSCPSNGSIVVTDDGREKYNISIEELSFLGGTEIIPRTIIAKKNRLILGNITDDIWDINEDLAIDDSLFFDSRAYSSDSFGVVKIKDKFNVELTLLKTDRVYTSSGNNVDEKHDCIQDKKIYLFHPQNQSDFGGEGKFVSYKLKKTSVSEIDSIDSYRYLKCGETYRFAIEFYNSKSQKSTPQWVADVKVPEYYGFSASDRNTIEFTISSDGIEVLKSQGIIGYKFLRVERTESDMSVVAQGIVSPMIFQETSDAAKNHTNESNGNLYKDNNVKISSPWIRHYQDQIDIPKSLFNSSLSGTADVKIFKLQQNKCISPHNPYGPSATFPVPWTEIYRDSDFVPASSTGLHLSFQDNRIMQLFSPETIFGNPQVYSGMKIRPVASLKQTKRSVRGKLIYTDTNDISRDESNDNISNLFIPTRWWTSGQVGENGNFLNANGYIGPNKPYPTEPGIKTEQLLQYYREYTTNQFLVSSSSSSNDLELKGSPELSPCDSQIRTYNGDDRFKYTNSLQSILSDGRVEFIHGTDNNSWDTPIYGVDSIAANNITFVLSTENPYETMIVNSFGNAGKSVSVNDNVILAEIIVDLQNQYGGKYYEDRSVNKYISIGKYQKIVDGDNVYNIINCGDVFVGDFLFNRITRVDGVQFANTRLQMSEIVKIPVETTINIFKRSDNSYGGWKSKFLPTNQEFHKYNKVYSQQPNAIISQPDPFLFIKNTNFTNRILATKPKLSGEIIDSWTDILPNEELYLEGEYGPINRFLKLNDNLYSFQRDGVSVISVLPRVQINPTDNIAIELGTGQVLSAYQYINTNSGCEDFDGMISTSSSIYYGDKIRRTLNMVRGSQVVGLSDALGVSQYIKGFDNDLSSRPRFVLGFNPLVDDILFSIKRQSNDGNGLIETIVYNERLNKFVSVLDMPAEFMFPVDGKMHSVSNSSKNKVWNHFTGGMSCNFYGEQKELELTICLNPENAQEDCIFNTLEWTHDIVNTDNPSIHYNDNITFMSSWNDFLTSNSANMSDIQRRFRMSRLFIPRSNSDNLSRMRGNYLFIKLKYLPDDPKKTILLNDIVLYYNGQR